MDAMKYSFVILALAIQPGVAIVHQSHHHAQQAFTADKKEISLYEQTGSALDRVEFALHHEPSDILLRPNAGNGPDEVTFGMRAMNFYGADLKHHTFSLDMVMSIKWDDSRVIKHIPKGLDKLSMSYKQAEKMMWMPGVVVSNRDIEKYEIISASVTIYRSGEVRRVERANTRIMKKFMLEHYPFDTQELDVNIASSKYMADEVVLIPDQEASGVYEDIWGLYSMVNWRTASYEKHDGELVKSRGSLQINVHRSLEKYGQDHLLPASIVLIISWAVFYFPFANPFITPRLALSILAMLTFTQLIVKSSKELPGAALYNYNDLFNQQIQTLMFVTIVLNVCSEIAFHTFHMEKLARALNNEAKVLMPFMSLLNIAIILLGGYFNVMTLTHTTQLVQVTLVILLAIYVGYNVNGHVKHQFMEVVDKLTGRNDAAKFATPREDVEAQCAAAAVAIDIAGEGGDDEGGCDAD